MSYYSSLRTGGGAGMRFTVSTKPTKPPSRGNSRRMGTRESKKRADSSNRLMRADKSNYSRGNGSASLSRTQGKRNSRIIFTEKTETQKPKPEPRVPPSYQSSSYMKDYQHNSISNISSKPNIGSYYNGNSINKPFGAGSTNASSGIGSSNLYQSTSSTSNFPKKIAVQRDTTNQYTSSYYDNYKRKESYTTKENEPSSKP